MNYDERREKGESLILELLPIFSLLIVLARDCVDFCVDTVEWQRADATEGTMATIGNIGGLRNSITEIALSLYVEEISLDQTLNKALCMSGHNIEIRETQTCPIPMRWHAMQELN